MTCDGSLTYAWLSDGTLTGVKADNGSGSVREKTYLGNVRSVIDISPSQTVPQILEQNDYLPFGTKIDNGSFATMTANRWRYAGKEEQKFGSVDIGLLNFGARLYDPFSARWTAMDPLVSKYSALSPFNYCGNNPINIVDPDGKIWETAWDVASLITGVKSFISNVKQGKVGAAVLDGIGIATDALAVALPAIPGGVGAGIKAIRAGDKAADVIKTVEKIDDAVDASKASSILSNTQRGLANEAKTLEKLGEVKNTTSIKVKLPDGKEVTTIPDINSSTKIGEIKDTRNLYNTKQIKAERQVAKDQGREFIIYTGPNTRVSKNISEKEILTLEWLGPQK